MNNNFQNKEMTESMPLLKSSRANYIFISDNSFIRRNSYFFKERIQIGSKKQPANIEMHLQFTDYCKFRAHPLFTYFILTPLNFRPPPKFCKPTRLFVQVYITFYGFEIQARNDEHYATNYHLTIIRRWNYNTDYHGTILLQSLRKQNVST